MIPCSATSATEELSRLSYLGRGPRARLLKVGRAGGSPQIMPFRASWAILATHEGQRRGFRRCGSRASLNHTNCIYACMADRRLGRAFHLWIAGLSLSSIMTSGGKDSVSTAQGAREGSPRPPSFNFQRANKTRPPQTATAMGAG